MIALALGPVAFGVRTLPPTRFRRSASYRWSSVPRIGGRPGRQWAGIGEERITLECVQAPGFGLRTALDGLRALAATGTAHLLVPLAGKPYGWWVVTRISDGGEPLEADGSPIVNTIRVDLERVDESLLSRAAGLVRRLG